MDNKMLQSIREQLQEIRNDYLQECRDSISATTNDSKVIEEFVARGAAAFDKSTAELANGNIEFTKDDDGILVGAVKVSEQEPKPFYKN